MKLENLKLANFGTHNNLTLPFNKKVNYIVGNNASGKTTIVESIAFLLTGINSRISKNGYGMEDLISFGESHSIVEATIDNIKIKREIPHMFHMEGNKGTLTENQEAFYKKYNINQNSAICSIFSSNFLDLDSNSQKEFLFDIIGTKITRAKIKSEFLIWCKANSIKEGDILFESVKFPDTQKISELVDEVYENYVEKRKELKRTIKSLESKLALPLQELPEGINVEMKDAIIKKIESLEIEKSDKTRKIGASEEQLRRKNFVNNRLLELAKTPVIKKDMIVLMGQRNKVENDISNIKVSISKYENRMIEIEKETSNLTKFSGNCILSTAIKCNINSADIENIKEKISVEYDVLNKKFKIEQNNLKDAILVKNDLDKNILIYQDYTKIEDEISNLKKELNALNSVIIDTTKLQNEFNILIERIKKGRDILDAIKIREQSLKDRTIFEKEVEISKVELQKVSDICDAFGPKGIKSLLLLKNIKDIEKLCSDTLKLITDGKYTMRLSMEEDFDIYIESGTIQRKVKHLSSSEKLRVGIAIQHAINIYMDIKLFITDNVDIFDKENFDAFVRGISKLKEAYDTMIIVFTYDDEFVMNYEDVNVYKIGTTTSLF